jgi:hypothetical protein
MGRLARPASGGLTKHYWYPGERADWFRAVVAAVSGLLTLVLVMAVFGSSLWGSVLGASVTAAIAGVSFGRRDAQALRECVKFTASNTGRAVWRALVKGFGPAAAAVLVVHTGGRGGFFAGYVLPLLPALVGSLAHQAGMMLDQVSLTRVKRVSTSRGMPLTTRRVSTKDLPERAPSTPGPVTAAPAAQ